MTWQAGVCPFYYTSHYTPALTSGTRDLAAVSPNVTITLGATGLGSDASNVEITVLDDKLGPYPAIVVATNDSHVEFQPSVQTYGRSKEMVVHAVGLGNALVAEADGPLLPEIQVLAHAVPVKLVFVRHA